MCAIFNVVGADPNARTDGIAHGDRHIKPGLISWTLMACSLSSSNSLALRKRGRQLGADASLFL